MIPVFKSGEAPLVQEIMNEARWVDFASRQLSQNPLTVWLDSAGLKHDRARFSYLSGRVHALIFKKGPYFLIHDLLSRAIFFLTEDEWDQQLELFCQQNLGKSQTTIWPVFTYECFSASPAALGHPIVRDFDAVFLVSENAYVYDRTTQLLTGPAQKEDGCTLDYSMAGWPFQEGGWREPSATYLSLIKRVQQHIIDGDYYQANLSQRFLGQTNVAPLELYKNLRNLNPSPYMGIVRLGDFWLLSGSPELLVDRNQQRLSSRPIAGTRPRSQDAPVDEALKIELQQSPKEQAEHLMLVDLIRHDLGRVANWGTVCVEEFQVVESYSHVHHLVSHVIADQRAGVSSWQVIKAMFPGGTITGAPKLACMKSLSELEGEARGFYTGSIGRIQGNGDLTLNILIRSLMIHKGHFCFHGGGGIVAASQPAAEYEETRHKCMALMAALEIHV